MSAVFERCGGVPERRHFAPASELGFAVIAEHCICRLLSAAWAACILVAHGANQPLEPMPGAPVTASLHSDVVGGAPVMAQLGC